MLAYYDNKVSSQKISRGAGNAPLFSRAWIKTIVAVCLLSVLMGVTFVQSLSSYHNSPVVYAETAEEQAKNALQDSLKSYSDKGISGAVEKYNQDKKNGNIDNNTFAFVVQRMFIPGYMNNTPQAVDPQGQALASNCNVNDTKAGTVLYHNCDVPNITAEFLQNVVSFLIPTGVQNASTDYAKIENPWFGLPSAIPAGQVPVDESLRTDKYTGLELYGYGFKLTSYNGEWDNIKVFTSARALSNFSGADKLTVGINAITNGLTSGIGQATSNFTTSISRGDILGAFGDAYKGFTDAGMSSTLNTILDTSDYNVFKTWSWYRVGFGSTAYGFRELTESEIADRQLAYYQEHMLGQQGVLKLPEDFVKLETPPSRPKENIASCLVADPNNPAEKIELGQVTASQNSLTEEDCRTKASETNPDNNDYTYVKDGLQKSESLKNWKESHKEWFDIASKYNLQCSIDVNDETNRASNLVSFYTCVDGQYRALSEKQNETMLAEASKTLVKESISAENFAKVFTGNTPANPNSPLARYVCVDSLGRDILQDGKKVYAFNNDGTPNSSCGIMRSPIQNGLFGNGYDKNISVPVDTRNKVLEDTNFGMVTPERIVFGMMSNGGLGVSSFVARISNTVVNLSFSPLTSTLGVDNIVITMIEDLRASVFLPLVVLMVTLSALLIFVNMVFRGMYMQALVAVVYIALSYIVAIAILFNPKGFLNVVDKAPATLEGAMATAIFETGSPTDNELCIATGDGVSYGGESEQSLFAYSNNGVRGIMCQVWYVYAFNPYVNAQWGTNYEKLYASNVPNVDGFKNTNGDLVGDAKVDMGGGYAINNWGLYQLETLTVGTTTDTPDEYGLRLGQVDPNIYRVVDLQAGINNGAGTDSRYLDSWRGAKPAERAVVALFGAINSVVGAFAIITFSLNKIIITFVTILMLLGLPFVLLAGVLYHGGRRILYSYGLTILSLMLERVFTVVLLALMLRFLLVASQLTVHYIFSALISMLVAVAFVALYKKFMAWLRQTITSKYGGSGGSLTMFTNQSLREMLHRSTPKTVRNIVTNRAGDARALTGSWVAGMLSAQPQKEVRDSQGNIVKPGKTRREVRKESMSRTVNDMRRRNFNIQRREGFSALQKVNQASNQGKKTAIQDISKQYRNNKDANQEYSTLLQKHLDDMGVRKKNRPKRQKTMSLDFVQPKDYENFVDKVGGAKDKNTTSIRNASQYRNVSKINKSNKKRLKDEMKLSRSDFSAQEKDSVRSNPTIPDVLFEQTRVDKVTSEAKKDYNTSNQVYEKYLDVLAKKEASRIKAEQDLQDYKDSIRQKIQAYQTKVKP